MRAFRTYLLHTIQKHFKLRADIQVHLKVKQTHRQTDEQTLQDKHMDQEPRTRQNATVAYTREVQA